MSAHRFPGSCGTEESVFTGFDRGTVLLGVVLLVVPVVVLASAAGRLGAARREQRLAALRLAGATPRQILAMTAVEAAGVGAAGALAGALAYTALLPALAELPYGVGTWYTGQLWVGLPWLAAVVLAVTALITVSAVTTLRQVATSPLGVAQQANPRRTRAIRLVLFVAVLGYIWATTGDGGQLKPRQLIAMLMLFYGAFWLLGPWVVDRLGRIVGRYANRPATLLAARRLSDDPRGAWRTVSGLVLAGFVAGFFSVSTLNFEGPGHERQVAVITANAADARHAAAEARTVLHRVGVTATVSGVREDDYDSLLGGATGVIAHVSGGQEDIDTAVTALTPVGSGRYPFTQEYVSAPDDTVIARIATVSTTTLVLGFLVAAASMRPHGSRERPRPAPGVRSVAADRHPAEGAGPGPSPRDRHSVGRPGRWHHRDGCLRRHAAQQGGRHHDRRLRCRATGALLGQPARSPCSPRSCGSRPLLRKVTAGPAQTAD